LKILKQKSHLLKNISAERIKQELDKILLLKNNVQALQDLKEIDFFKHIIPEIDVLEKVP
jgi:tRNA nucleotidyltransferase/poly(A) polymerase